MEKYGGNLPTKSKPKAKKKATPKRTKRTVKVDTGDILANATPASRRKVQNTVTAKPKGAKHKVTVDTGNILQGQTVKAKPKPQAKHPSFTRALKDELEGKGALAEAAKRAGPTVAKALAPDPPKFTYKGHNVNSTQTAGGLGQAKVAKRGQRFVKDILNVAATLPAAAYVPAAAAVEAAHGDTHRGKEFIDQIRKTDPGYALVTGHPKKALKLADQHPGFAALEAAGGVGTVGRTLGHGVRTTGKVVRTVNPKLGEKIRRVGAVETRPNAVTPHTAHEHVRQYSPDLIVKGVQVHRDKSTAKATAKLRARADRIQDIDSEHAIVLRKQANQQDRLVASTKQIHARENLQEAAGETRRKDAHVEIDAKQRKIVKAMGDKGAAPVLVTSGVTRATVADLIQYRRELATAYQTLKNPGKRADNVALRKAIDRSIQTAGKKGDPNLTDIREAAQRYHQSIDVPLDRQLAELGILSEHRGQVAKHIPVAARELGATRQVIDPLADAQRAARADLRAAKRQRRAAGKRATRQIERAGVAQGRAEIKAGQADTITARQIASAQRAVALHERSARNHLRHDRPAEAGRARERAAAAQERLKALQMAVDRKPTATLRVLERERGKSQLTDRRLLAAQQRVKVAAAEHRDVSAARRAAKGPAIVDREGNRLGLDELQAVAERTRDVPPSYVSQSPKSRSPIAYFRSASKEPAIDTRARTEKPTIEGTFNADPEALRARATNATGLIVAAKNFRRGIAEMAYRGEDGQVRDNLTGERADELIADLNASEGTEWKKVKVRPWAADSAHIESMIHDINTGVDLDPREIAAFHKSMTDAYDLEDTHGKADGPYAIIPAAAAKQRVDFLNTLNPGGAERGARAVRSSFTRTILTTSPGPTVGNLIEPIARAGVQRAGVLSTVRARRVMNELKTLDPEAHAQLKAMIGRGKITLSARRHYVDPMQFNQGTVRNLVESWQNFKQARGGKQITAAWDLWTRVVFEQVNGRAEAFFREGPMLGKVLKDSGLMEHSLLGLSSKAMREAAEGLTNTATQAHLAAKLNEAYGKYQGFSPTGKRIIADFTPFAAWWLSAATFIFKVLPRDHPTIVALSAATVNATRDWRRAQGLDLFQGAGALPPWLQGTVAAGKAGRVKVAYNTPFGATSDPLATVASLVFPQGETVLKAFEGMDWKNAKLRNDDGTPYDVLQQGLYAAGELLKSTVPAVAVPTRVTRYAKSPRALLNPVLIPPSKPKARKATAGSARKPANPADALINGAGAVNPADALIGGGGATNPADALISP